MSAYVEGEKTTGHALETQISRENNTHRALDEALEHLDNNDWEQTTGIPSHKIHTISNDMFSDQVREEDMDPSHLYAKVDKMRGKKHQEEDDVAALYAKIDKSKKARQEVQKEKEDANESHPPQLESEGEIDDRLRPPMPLPPDNSSTSERPLSGIYEEVESLRAQVAIDTSGYTEVGGRRVEVGYEVGYSGTGSLHKLCNMLGPEFSTMTGKSAKVANVAGTLPEGRRGVEVVMLSGKTVKFAVGVSATVSELFEQVVSSQSLKETHVFGLAVRRGTCVLNLVVAVVSSLLCVDREDFFLDANSKLAKHAPPHWAQSTNHTSFTLFFRVKHYVENVNQLSQHLTRHLYYLQLRKDLIGMGISWCSPYQFYFSLQRV